MAAGDLVKLGTLYVGSTKHPSPTRPWRTDTTPPGAPGVGNIPSYAAGQTIEIRNTDANDAYKATWREVMLDGKKLLVADKMMLVNVSHDDLLAQGLITGKEITIDGQQYKLRLLTGGTDRRGGDAYAGGTPINNEWDRIISNEANLSGLPMPVASDLDSSANATDFNSAHNKFWNWFYAYSWVQETYAGGSSYRVLRGYISARHLNWSTSSSRYANHGWRPVLEVLNSAPLISGGTQNLGEKTNPFSLTYQVSDPEGDVVNVIEKLNGTTIGTFTNVTQSVDRKIDLTLDLWAALPLNLPSTITVEATDSKGAKSTRVHTFTKTNAAPDAFAVEPKGDLANIKILDTTAPIAVWRFQDIDPNDSQSAYQIIFEDLNNAVVHDSGKKLSTQSFYAIPESILQWGGRYKWKVRVWDKYDVPSEYSFPEFFMPNRAPNATNLQPGSDDPLAPIGAGLAPEFSWDFEDLDLEAQAAYQLRVFKAADDTLAFDTSRINRNLLKHQVPVGVLVEGTAYYAIVTVWDPNNLSGDTERAYIVTNATPSAPILTGPIDNYRTTNRPVLHGLVGTDPEDDGMHFAVQIAKDVEFTKNLVTLRSDTERAGWQVGGYDIPEEGVKNDQEGQALTYQPQFDLAINETYYWRFAAIDAITKAVGTYVKGRRIRSGNRLEFPLKSLVPTGAVAARRLLYAADYFISQDGTNKAVLKVEFSNNALDIVPTWEDATEEFIDMDYYNFTNTEKTAEQFAIGVRYLVIANDAMGPIHVDAFGLTFD